MSKVSFDYDDTLSRKDIQKYANSLIKAGHEVWITTSRYDAVEKYATEGQPLWKTLHLPEAWNELFEVAEQLGIPKEQILFTNKQSKVDYIEKQGFLWHLDDDVKELFLINNKTTTVGIWTKDIPDYRATCNYLLNKLD
jgi:hypothetical protein